MPSDLWGKPSLYGLPQPGGFQWILRLWQLWVTWCNWADQRGAWHPLFTAVNSLNMIEVEKKFQITLEQLKRIEESAEFVKEVTNTDVYYDTPDYQLLRKDRWLRSRDGKFEAKIRPDVFDKNINTYEEITNSEEILKRLNIPKLTEDFEVNLKQNGLEVLVKLVTKRRKFKIKDLIIDIDEVDYGYTVCEIEKMVERESEVENATKDIFDLAASLGLEIKRVRGKGMEYFFRFKPEVYKIFNEVRYE